MRLFAPLKHALFARFFVGQAVSQVGDFVFLVALTWHVIALTGSSLALGSVMSAMMGAQLVFLLWGGVIVDRFPRRTVIVVSDVLQALGAGTLAVLAFTDAAGMLALHVIAAFFGAAQAFAMPALAAFVPETVPREGLASANGLYEATRTTAAIVGPAVGAFIIAASGTDWAFALNAASFGVSALLLGTVRVPPKPAPAVDADAPVSSPLRDVRDGFRYVMSVPWLWITILVFALVNAAEAGPRNVVLPTFVTNAFGTGPEGVGLLLTAQAVGMLIGYLVMGQIGTPKRRGLWAYAATALTGLALAPLAFVTSFWQALALGVLRGLPLAVFGMLWHLTIQDQVPERMRGRVFSLDILGSFALLPASALLSGVLAEAVGARTVFLGGGLVITALAVGALVYRPASAFTPFERGEPEDVGGRA